jgi:N-acetylglucosaminyl-diphospho-decaprenol L-rhamnosyltransferase
VPPTFEVLVVSYASAPMIERLLASLASLVPEASVAIREHSSDARAMAALTRVADAHSGPVRIDHDPSNPGFGAGCNALARTSSADFLVFLNPDTELVAWPWAPASPPPRGTVLGPIMVDSGPPSEHYGRSYRIRDEIARSWLRRRPKPPNGRGYVSGAALLMERTAFERVGGFDSGFFLFYEDIDLCLRANAAGYPTVIEPGWKVRHARRHSTEARFGQALQWSYESAVRFHSKHGSPVSAYRVYVAADGMMRAGLQLARGRRDAARAYLMLAWRAARELAG